MRTVLIMMLFSLSWRFSLACIGDGCVHDRERDQFFWCSGNIGQERDSIKSWYGELNKAAYEGYCTGVSAMVVTTNQELRRLAERMCGGQMHEVICHEDISYRILS